MLTLSRSEVYEIIRRHVSLKVESLTGSGETWLMKDYYKVLDLNFTRRDILQVYHGNVKVLDQFNDSMLVRAARTIIGLTYKQSNSEIDVLFGG